VFYTGAKVALMSDAVPEKTDWDNVTGIRIVNTAQKYVRRKFFFVEVARVM